MVNRDTDLLNAKQFQNLVCDQLGMNANDLLKLNRVSGFADIKASETLRVDLVVKNFMDRLEKSEKLRKDCIKKIVKLLKEREITTIDMAMKYLDEDGSGSITRGELDDAFKTMNVPINIALRNNLFSILDKNNDGDISLEEFEAVFGEYMATGGPV